MDPELKALVERELELARKHTEDALRYMARFGVRPGGEIRLFYPPDVRRKTIDRIPYTRPVRERVVYRTEPGEFSAVCPFSGLPDYGVLTVEYVRPRIPGSRDRLQRARGHPHHGSGGQPGSGLLIPCGKLASP